MADDTVTADSPPLTPAEHLLHAQAHAGAAHEHAAQVVSHLDAARAPDTDDGELTGDESELSGGDGGGDATRTLPASAQSRAYSFPAGSGAARSLRAATGGRRG